MSLLFRIVCSLNHIDLPLFMIYKVNVTLLREFLGLYCPSKLIIRLTHYVFLISLLFRIISSQNQFHLPLFMINKVNVILLRQFLGLYCPPKIIIRLTHDVCFIPLLFRIVSSLSQFHLSLFMMIKVNVTLLRQFLGLYCPSKLIIRLTYDVFLISLFVRIVSNLNHIDLSLFMIYKVNVTLLRQFLGLYCLSKLIIWLSNDFFSISLLFRIVSSQNQFHLFLFMINKVNDILLRQFLGLYCPFKIIIRLTHDVCFISLLFRIVSNLNHIVLPLFMIYKVNVTLLRQFLGLYCVFKLIIRLPHYVFLISLLFRIVSSQNQFHLPLFMINKVNDTLLRQFLGLYCPSKLIIRLTYDVFLISLLVRIVSSLNQFHLSLFMMIKVNVTLLRQFLGLYCPSKLIIRLTYDVFLISLLVRIVSNLNHIDLPLFMIYKVNVTLLRQFLGLYCPSKLIIRLTHYVFLISLLFRIVSSLNQFHLSLFMMIKVNVTLLRQFLGLYCVFKLIIRLTHYVFLISLLFRIVSSQNQFHLPLFMINKVNVTLLRQFLGLYCPSKLIIRLTYDVFLISLLVRIVSSLNQFHLSLFMMIKVNVTLLRQFLGLYCPSKLIIRLTYDVFLISLLVRIVSNLNHIDLPLFMIYKVNVTLLRQFLGLYCPSKLIIRLTHYVFLISLLFRIVSSLNQFHLSLFMMIKVNVTFLRQFLGLYCPSKLIIRLTYDVFLISILVRIVSNLNHIDLPLFMIYKVNVTLLRQFLGLYCLSKLIIRLSYDFFSISLLFRIVSSQNQFHLPLFMINKGNDILLRQFLGLYCPSKIIIRLTHDVCFISLLFNIVSNLNHIVLPLFMIYKVNVTLLRQFLGLYCLSKLIIWLSYDFFSISLLFRIVSSQNQFHLPLFMINKVDVTLLRQFLGLYCPSKLIIRLTYDVFLISLLVMIVSSLNQFHLSLFMMIKVNVTLLRQFLGLYCPSKLIIRLTYDVFLISLLVRIVSNLNHIDLPLFMIYKVNVTLLRQFLGLYCLSKLIIRLSYDFFSISLLFRIVSSQNLFHLPLFMINKVNVILLRQFLGLYCPSKIIIRLTHDVCFILLLFRIVSSLNHIDSPLFMITKVNVTLLRQFLGLFCLSKLIIRLSYDFFSISLLFRIVSSQNQFHLLLFMINKVYVTLLRQFLGLYYPSVLSG